MYKKLINNNNNNSNNNNNNNTRAYRKYKYKSGPLVPPLTSY